MPVLTWHLIDETSPKDGEVEIRYKAEDVGMTLNLLTARADLPFSEGDTHPVITTAYCNAINISRSGDESSGRIWKATIKFGAKESMQNSKKKPDSDLAPWDKPAGFRNESVWVDDFTMTDRAGKLFAMSNGAFIDNISTRRQLSRYTITRARNLATSDINTYENKVNSLSFSLPPIGTIAAETCMVESATWSLDYFYNGTTFDTFVNEEIVLLVDPKKHIFEVADQGSRTIGFKPLTTKANRQPLDKSFLNGAGKFIQTATSDLEADICGTIATPTGTTAQGVNWIKRTFGSVDIVALQFQVHNGAVDFTPLDLSYGL
jgi:hypothetical protein